MLGIIKKAAYCVLTLVFVFNSYAACATVGLAEASVVGKVESVFNNRVSLKILNVEKISEGAENIVATGSWVSFDLPNDLLKGKRNDKIQYGSVIQAELIGNTATEYELTTDGDRKDVQAHNVVLLWNAQSVKLLKNGSDYLPEEEKTGNKKRGKKKNKEPLKIWTSKETVRGVIHSNNDKLYVKEERLGRRDKGLEILGEDWKEKLTPYVGNIIVLHGTTNRTSLASGTLEIANIMKIYSNK